MPSWLDTVDDFYKEMFLQFLKSPAAVELMNGIIYSWGDTIVWTEIPVDSNEAKLCFAAFNQGIMAHITELDGGLNVAFGKLKIMIPRLTK